MERRDIVIGVIFFILNMIVGYMFIIWVWTNEPHLAVVTGVLGIIVSVANFVKPELADRMPYRKLVGSKDYRAQS